MRITRPVLLLASVLLVTAPLVVAGQPKYEVRVNTMKAAELAKAKTYQWTTGNAAFNKKADALIIAAVDRELAARGLAKIISGPSDLTVSYASVTRTDADVKANASKDGALPGLQVGTLVVDLKDAKNQQLVFRVRTDTPIQNDSATLEPTINAAVTAIFGKYPTPSKR